MSTVFTLRDLEQWARPGVSLAVLGDPIKHSISPAMHNAALATLAARDPAYRAWEYFRFQIPPAALPTALELFYAKKFHGLNLTVPHKVLAFDLVPVVSDAARAVGAVNTLRWTDAGWSGNNTDGYGLATALHEALGLKIAGAHIILLGAGGAARSAAVECLNHGCASLAIANRTAANLSALLGAVAGIGGKIPRRGFSPDRPPADLPEGAVVINATSAGLRDSDPAPIDLQRLPRPASVFDMIYNPPRTALLRQAESLGIPSANGLAMLVHQGATALEIWSGAPAAQLAPAMRTAASDALAGS